jgi:hypothetical protein
MQHFLRHPHTILWIAPDVYVCVDYTSSLADHMVLQLNGDFELNGDFDAGIIDRTTLYVFVRSGMAAASATATCDFAVRLLATCENNGVTIQTLCSREPASISGAGLSLFFQESRSCLRTVSLPFLDLNEDQCRALATMSRLDVGLNVYNCTLPDDAAGVFVESLQSDRGPVQLIDCKIYCQILASGLAGNSRGTKLWHHDRNIDEANMAVLFTALANNKGLANLGFGFYISSENWSILCNSLKAHPTVYCLDLRTSTRPRSPTGDRIVLMDDQKIHRTRAIAEMMLQNTILHTIALSEDERDEQIYAEMIRPYLETNRYTGLAYLLSRKRIF